jgi:hypothetical protein
MTLIKRWPAVLTRNQFRVARLSMGLAIAIAMLVWVDLLIRWQEAGWLYKIGALIYLGILSPSLPDVFESYESYEAEQSKRFVKSSVRHE